MTNTASPESTNPTDQGAPDAPGHPQAIAGLVCGALAVAAAVWAYWLLLPGIVLGIAAVVLGATSHRRGAREAGGIALVLGVVALFLVPSVLFMIDGAEDWGRECALNPANPDC